jgi:hypothetical protein
MKLTSTPIITLACQGEIYEYADAAAIRADFGCAHWERIWPFPAILTREEEMESHDSESFRSAHGNTVADDPSWGWMLFVESPEWFRSEADALAALDEAAVEWVREVVLPSHSAGLREI